MSNKEGINELVTDSIEQIHSAKYDPNLQRSVDKKHLERVRALKIRKEDSAVFAEETLTTDLNANIGTNNNN